jgi:Tat protein translocase TatB subunit
MPSFPGPLEVLVIAVIALLVFGPEKLPQIAKQVGRAAAELRRMAAEVKDEFDSGFEDPADDGRAAGRSTTGDLGPVGRPRSTEEPFGDFDRFDHPSGPDEAVQEDADRRTKGSDGGD